MIRRLLFILAAATTLAPLPASAHPHVYVTVKSELVYGPDGAATAIRHAWTFDDLFSTYATQGLQTKEKGVFTKEELAPLAEVNVTTMKEYNYFTYAKADGKKIVFEDAKDYWLEYKDSSLILHFTLPIKGAPKAKAFELEVYDPEYFIDLTFDEKNPAKLAGAPSACKMTVTTPQQPEPMQRFGRSFSPAEANAGMGAQFASKISVKCQ